MKESLVAGLLLTILLFTTSWLHAAQPPAPALAEEPAAPTPAATPTATPAEALTQTAPATLPDDQIQLRAKIGNTVQTVTMANYLPGVIRAEMSPAFELEALKAQAVAERTYICYQMEKGAKAAHPDADVCDSAACCSAYLSEADARQKWGDSFEVYEQRVQAAVADTDGVVMLYGGAPIMAVFHSSSAGKTAACDDVWTAELPYLVSVESPETADTVPNYYSVRTFSRDEFRRIFADAHHDADFSGTWIADRRENASGRVESVTVGGITVTGGEMRNLYGLRSTCFTLEEDSDAITFHVTGYGHGVGMSQYGAQELAKEGRSWREILQWYYTDITFGGYTNR